MKYSRNSTDEEQDGVIVSVEQIGDFLKKLVESNLGAVTQFERADENAFHYMFLCHRDSQIAYSFSRQIIILDACHL